MYTLGQKFSDFFLHVSNLQIKIWHIVILSIVCNLYNSFISVLIRYASVGIKDEPEYKSAILT